MQEEKEFYELYSLCYNKIHNYVNFIIGKKMHAEDITQEVFFLAYEKWDELKNHSNREGWLYKTAYNIVMNHRRKHENRAVSLSELDDMPMDEKTLSAFDDVDTQLTLEQILGKEETELLRLFYLDGYSISEIAEMKSVSEGSMRVKLHRIRKRIRGRLECGNS